jgi:hypothetical protein
MEPVYIKHSCGCKPFRVRAMRLGVVLAHLICFSFIILPLSYGDTIWLRNGNSYSDVTIIEETDTELVLEFQGGRTRTVLRSTVVGHIVDTKAKTGIEPGGRSIKLRSQSPQARPRSRPSAKSGKRSLRAYRGSEGIPLLTNNPHKYDAQYEEILTQVEPIKLHRPGGPHSSQLLKRALSQEIYVSNERRSYSVSLRGELDETIKQHARLYGVPPELVMAVIKAESNFNPKAVSSKGAQGLMQLMPRTAAAMGITDPFDPEQNIAGGTQYLSKLLKMFGNERLAVAAYNAGPGRVKRYGGVPPYRETREYVDRVFRHIDVYASRFSS